MIDLSPEAVDRLKRWRDVGDHPDAAYCAGNAQFGDDVKALLAERDAAREALRAMMEGNVWRDAICFGGVDLPASWSTVRMPDTAALDLARAVLNTGSKP